MAFKGTKGLKTSNEPVVKEDASSEGQPSSTAPAPDYSESSTSSPNFAATTQQQPESTDSDELVLPDFLKQKKDPVEDSMNDAFRTEATKKSAYQMTLKTLNALKIVSPIISALMQKPGVDASNTEMTDAFRKLIQEISIASAKTCEKMEIDPDKEKNFWVRNVLEKNFAEIFKNQWVATGDINSDQLLSLMSIVIEKSETFADQSDIKDFDAVTTLKVATFKSVSKVLNEALTHFDLFRNLENDMEEISEKLFNFSGQVVDRLANDFADKDDRAKLFYIIMQEAGELYASAWHNESERILEIMKHTPQDRVEKTKSQYQSKGGLPLNKVDHEFEKYFNKLVVITEKLISSPKSGLDKKLKNKP